ncbi:pyruvate carboxylase, partial [Aureobasidium melanogenum]
MPTTTIQRPIKKLLVANRGEIAIRILQSVRELPNSPETYGLYTSNDSTHISLGRPNHAIEIPSPASYMDVSALVQLAKDRGIDAVHPGYGFLSESPEFARQMWEQANCMVIGPGSSILETTGDKLEAKTLAAKFDVPVLPAMTSPSQNVEDISMFANKVGFPIMIKAADGGGGRGIRLVREAAELQTAVQRCIAESPSGKVFAEKAAVDGFKHIEIQIIGDGKGGVKHVWERDCSMQRRFQKIVEVAPAVVTDRSTVTRVIAAAMRIAQGVNYLGLGTFEFLVNVDKKEFYFLEINPRIQVEHTISESIANVDLVHEQLLLAQGLTDHTADLPTTADANPPSRFSVQLRLCAEDPNAGFSLSTGNVTKAKLPSGNGVRVDSHIVRGAVVGSDFDNLLAKIIVTASSWQSVVVKARRALEDTEIVGVKTNLSLLRAIVADREFESGTADNQWLEKNVSRLLGLGDKIGEGIQKLNTSLPAVDDSASQTSGGGAVGGALLRKGNAWSLSLSPVEASEEKAVRNHHVKIEKVLRNDFPDTLSAVVAVSTSGAGSQTYKMSLESTDATQAAVNSKHRKGDASNKAHIILPMNGKLVEMLVEEGEEVKEGQVIAFVRQMKMELEVRSPRSGTITWALKLEDEEGDDVEQGVLLAVLKDEHSSDARMHKL